MPISETTITANCELTGEALGRAKFFYYLNIVLTWFIAVVLLFAGVSKIIVPEGLIDNLSSVFSFLPETVVIMVSTLLPVVEVSLGFLLISSLFYSEKLKSRRKTIKLLTVTLFGVFLLYSIFRIDRFADGFVIGSGSDCGCFGNAVTTNFGWGMMMRNLVLLLISIFISVNEFARVK